MRAPLSWLRDFSPFGDDAAELAATLDDLGLVVEGIERVGEGLGDLVVARVEEIAAIPGADRIRRVVVETGTGRVEVVCGASNFAAGDLVPLAPVGAVLPGGMAIARRKMKGVVSEGMLCSGRELGLSEDQDGLLLLSELEGARPGLPLTEALGLVPDVVFDLAVEGNRPDAWCMAGVARDLAARLHLPFVLPDPALPPEAGAAVGELASLVVESTLLCPRMTARVLTGVRVGPSPRWLARRLTLAGMRPINNVVDASNYVMLELGQPTHPYDLARLPGSGLVVRAARRGERVETLDGVVRTLGVPGRGLGDLGADCVICDAEGTPVGIGGVMGGSSSEISPGTATVLVETAYFTPMAIARTSRRLALRTEASARFERGTDPWGVDRATDRFCELVAMSSPDLVLAPGQLEVRGDVPGPVRVTVDPARVNALLGTQLGAQDVGGLLGPLGFGFDLTGPSMVVTVPTNRPDVRPEPYGFHDVVEEVARCYGYSRIPRRRPSWPQPGALTVYQRERRLTRDVLAGLGASEAVTSSLVAATDDTRLGLDGPGVEVENPLVGEEGFLRRSLLPGLLRSLARNVDRRQGDIRLFEVGTVFDPPIEGDRTVERSGAGGTGTTELPGERELLAVALAGPGDDGRAAVAAWRVLAEALRLVDVFVVAPGPQGVPSGASGDSLAQGVPTAVPAGLHPTRSARLVSGEGTVVGTVGEVDPRVVSDFGAGSGRIGWLEVDLGLLLNPAVLPRRSELARPVSRFPSSDVDLAVVAGDEVPAERVARALATAGGELLESVVLFDVFRGEAIGSGRRSLTFRLRFCALDRTLTDAEVGALRQTCIDAAAAVGATLR
ncbi:MAG TPA: phenylalanine--tRNA ligase subunit beta [Acidimicrobiales bacterium]|nr:phenylalanine--tRNA ligase subunit beta [Acidimicrobiales bacterium]